MLVEPEKENAKAPREPIVPPEAEREVMASSDRRRIARVLDSIAGNEGVLRSITATHAILERDEQRISVSTGTFLDHVARQRQT